MVYDAGGRNPTMAVDPSPERFRDLMLGDEPGLE